ncbi:MAG TPA: hypothetical protein VIB01_03140 [Steroidobacteraceae bacterium]|jgi:hypothetical protein
MAGKLLEIAKALTAGLTYAARTTAMREGLPWDGDGRVASMGLIRGLELRGGSSGGVPGKRPRHR